MPKRRKKTWSIPRITDPRYPGFCVRIAELQRGGSLYAIRMVDGKQKMTSLRRSRADLGTTDKEQEEAARALGLNIIEELATGGLVESDPRSRAHHGSRAVVVARSNEHQRA
jgi:hypothetical protein